MTQEEKANAYDKVRGKIALRFGSNVAEEIFSEFEMSEDEKIIKEIISIVKSYRENCITEGNHEFDNCLAWLETQSKQKPTNWSEEDEKKRNLLINILNVNHSNGYFKVNPANTLNMEAVSTEELVDWLKSLKQRIGE